MAYAARLGGKLEGWGRLEAGAGQGRAGTRAAERESRRKSKWPSPKWRPVKLAAQEQALGQVTHPQCSINTDTQGFRGCFCYWSAKTGGG